MLVCKTTLVSLFFFTNFENMAANRNSSGNIHFFFQGVKFSLTNRNSLKQFLLGLFKKEGKSVLTVNYIFVTDDALLQINRQYLSHDYYTDIITFDLSEDESITADIFISIDRVRENAISASSSLKKELHRVIFHGALHLCGYKDKTKPDQTTMRAKEDHYIRLYLS